MGLSGEEERIQEGYVTNEDPLTIDKVPPETDLGHRNLIKSLVRDLARAFDDIGLPQNPRKVRANP